MVQRIGCVVLNQWKHKYQEGILHYCSYISKKKESVGEFKDIFKDLLIALEEIPREINMGAKSVKEYKISRNKFRVEKIDPIIINILPEWGAVREEGEGQICSHSMLVCWLISEDDRFKELDKEDKNILLWASLLHDIGKRCPGAGVKDPAHPYISAAHTLHILPRIYTSLLHRHSAPLIHMLSTSHIQTNNSFRLPDLSKIRELMGTLDAIYPPQSFMNVLIRLIALHQSLPGVAIYPALVQLEEVDIAYCLDDRLLTLFLIFMTADSLSYLQWGGFSHFRLPLYTEFITNNIHMYNIIHNI